jgi:glyoxylase-like metal-dependent hydrolase (beta-lactamase superfamily II)
LTDTLVFDRDFDPAHDRAVEIAPIIRRVTANNPGPFTFSGTNSYIVGRGQVAVIDPGPADAAHTKALLDATAGERISHIVLTHTHRDHAGGLADLAERTGAAIVGCAPQEFSPNLSGEAESGSALLYRPERVLGAGDVVEGPGWVLEAVPTPGHAANHLAFALRGTDTLFSGDHVMGWSTTVVTPPDGSMKAYRASLRLLLDRPEDLYLPGHGPAVRNAKAYVQALLRHREAREAAILAELATAPRTVPDLVAALYPGLDPKLQRAAAASVLAHLEELHAGGRILVEGAPSPKIDALFRRG